MLIVTAIGALIGGGLGFGAGLAGPALGAAGIGALGAAIGWLAQEWNG